MRSTIFLLVFIFGFVILSFPSSAHCEENICTADEHNFTEVKQLIDSKVPCEDLTNEQLEEIGDYYMEQMHPGEQHEIMDEMMGGEGSESVKQMHIQIARNIYCNESNQNMMWMMNMMGGYGMAYGMMDGYNMMYGYAGFGWLNQILLTIVLVLLILVLYKMYTKKR